MNVDHADCQVTTYLHVGLHEKRQYVGILNPIHCEDFDHWVYQEAIEWKRHYVTRFEWV
jgi:hypothetical protein